MTLSPPSRSIGQGLLRFIESEEGPTAVEYAVMLALIIVASVTIVRTLGTSVSSSFNRVNTTLSS